jgi:uncharacterized protein (TIGR04255 family)
MTHVGLLWNKFRREYPNVQHALPIAMTKGEVQVESVTGLPLPRAWFINQKDDQLIQFQSDRFYYNWRRRKDEYPRYQHVIKNFEYVQKTVSDFFDEFGLGQFKPLEYELTYINHIPQGQGWNSKEKLEGVFRDFNWNAAVHSFLQSPSAVSWQSAFELPQNKGHLNVGLRMATRTTDKVPLLVLELRATGIGESSTGGTFREWFDLAHEWIVRGFTDLTTPSIHKIWEREDNVADSKQ